MEQEIYDVAEMLAACFKDAPVTLTILPRVNAYNVRTQSGHCIWADDLPTGGYKDLLRAMSLLMSERVREAFQEKFSSEQLSGKGTFWFASFEANPTRSLSIEGKTEGANIILNVGYAA